jgi:major membrane immunogen (membrane-anchored lipoprotein)
LGGKKQPNDPDILAVTGALDYQKNGYQVSAKLEYRDEKGNSTAQDSYLAETFLFLKFQPEYSLLLRERFLFSDNGTGERVTSRTVLGLAYRPVNSDWFNGLARLEYKKDTDTTASLRTDSDAYIISTEGIVQVTSRLQVVLKYAAKLVAESQADSRTNMAATRIVFDLAQNIDVAGEYRAMTNNLQSGFAGGGTAEVGMRVKDSLWVSAGYTFDRFDSDLKGDDATNQGPFIRMRVKFDEKGLARMAKTALLMW